MKKVTFALSLSLLLLLGACGRSDEKTEQANQPDETTIKLGVMPSTDNMPFIVAHEQGFDKKHGVSIELETFKSGKDRDAAFQAGTVDAINADLVGVAMYLQGGMDVKITSATYGQFDLIGASDVKTSADVEGKQIAVLKNQGPEFAAEEILKSQGIKPSEVTFVDVPQVPSRMELLTNNQAGAAILPEPFVTMAAASDLVNLGSTRDLGINLFAITFTSETIKEKEAAIQGMYEAYDEAVNWMKENDKETYIHLFVDKVGFPETLKEKIVVPDYPKAEQVKVDDLQKAFDWAREKGILKEEISPKEVLSDVYFK